MLLNFAPRSRAGGMSSVGFIRASKRLGSAASHLLWRGFSQPRVSLCAYTIPYVG